MFDLLADTTWLLEVMRSTLNNSGNAPPELGVTLGLSRQLLQVFILLLVLDGLSLHLVAALVVGDDSAIGVA